MSSAATDEERQKIRQEMMDQMTPEERQQFEERARTRQRGGQGAPGGGRRGQGGQGGGQGAPPGGPQ
jgi:Spy/CpxP family protein refolding chaperone